jgi:cytidyltransferase-like protein
MKALTVGTFDLIHVGHIRLFKKIQKLIGHDGILVVGINTDEFIEKYKGKPPVMSYEERLDGLQEILTGAYFYPNSQPDGTMKDLIEYVGPNMIVVGSDWLRKDYLKQIGVDADYLDEKGIWLTYVNYDPTISTTELKRRINEA